jgi:hypothetical protein
MSVRDARALSVLTTWAKALPSKHDVFIGNK